MRSGHPGQRGAPASVTKGHWLVLPAILKKAALNAVISNRRFPMPFRHSFCGFWAALLLFFGLLALRPRSVAVTTGPTRS